MEVYGKEVKFRRTIQANMRIADLAGGDPNKIFERLQGDYNDGQLTAARFMIALNEGYENYRKFTAGKEPEPVTEEELLNLDDDTFNALFDEALHVWIGDAVTTVEAEPAKPAKGTKKKPAGKK